MSGAVSKKTIIGILSVSSMVFANMVKERPHHTPTNQPLQHKLMLHHSSPKFFPPARNIASQEVKRVAQFYLPFSEKNSKMINAKWEITRIIDENERVTFDKNLNPEDRLINSKVSFKLIRDSLIRVKNDNEQIYKISLLSDFGTITLFKKFGKGYNIIEAKKVLAGPDDMLLDVPEEAELVLDSALNPRKSDKPLNGDHVSGHVFISKKSIQELEIRLSNGNDDNQDLSISNAELSDNGNFMTTINGEEISGVVINNGKSGYKIKFKNGPLAKAELDFITKELVETLENPEPIAP